MLGPGVHPFLRASEQPRTNRNLVCPLCRSASPLNPDIMTGLMHVNRDMPSAQLAILRNELQANPSWGATIVNAAVVEHYAAYERNMSIAAYRSLRGNTASSSSVPSTASSSRDIPVASSSSSVQAPAPRRRRIPWAKVSLL
jgi:hypothetical protein